MSQNQRLFSTILELVDMWAMTVVGHAAVAVLQKLRNANITLDLELQEFNALQATVRAFVEANTTSEARKW